MTTEMLYDAITEIKDELVDEAARTMPAKKHISWMKFGLAAAALAVVVGLGLGARMLGGNSSGYGPGEINDAPGSGEVPGHDGSTTFMSYAGPVFPLTAAGGGEGLTARREVTYDFAGWDSLPWPYRLPVTDRYTLTNDTGEDKTVTLLYPFASSLMDLRDDTPALTADGAALNTVLHSGGYSGGFQTVFGSEDGGLWNLEPLTSWEQYRELLFDGRYLEDALGNLHDLTGVPVIVYEFTDCWGPEPNAAAGIPNPTIRAEFELDYDKTTVLSYGFHGGSFDPDLGHMMQSFSIPQDFEPNYGSPFYLIVLGDDIENLTTQGYVTGGADTKDTVEAEVTVRRYETDLDSALRAAAELMYRGCSWWSEWDERDWPDFELYFGLLKDDLLAYGLLADNPVARYSYGFLSEVNTDVVAMDRVFYLEASAVIPAGGSVTVEAAFGKDASFNFSCGSVEHERVYGYDLVTRLGTRLNIAEQTARAVHTDGVEIVRQNYGFDWENGVDTVTLDPDVEHYYLEVRQAGSN